MGEREGLADAGRELRDLRRDEPDQQDRQHREDGDERRGAAVSGEPADERTQRAGGGRQRGPAGRLAAAGAPTARRRPRRRSRPQPRRAAPSPARTRGPRRPQGRSSRPRAARARRGRARGGRSRSRRAPRRAPPRRARARGRSPSAPSPYDCTCADSAQARPWSGATRRLDGRSRRLAARCPVCVSARPAVATNCRTWSMRGLGRTCESSWSVRCSPRTSKSRPRKFPCPPFTIRSTYLRLSAMKASCSSRSRLKRAPPSRGHDRRQPATAALEHEIGAAHPDQVVDEALRHDHGGDDPACLELARRLLGRHRHEVDLRGDRSMRSRTSNGAPASFTCAGNPSRSTKTRRAASCVA